MTNARAEIATFSLLGGPLHRLGCRLGLVRDGTHTIRIGLALGGALWAVLVALALIEGNGGRVFSLAVVAGHVRLLAVIPLFFLCESWLDPQAGKFVAMIARSEVVPATALPALRAAIACTRRWKDSWLPEAVCLLTVTLWSMYGSFMPMAGVTAAYDPSRFTSGVTMAARWYWVVCLPLFRFLILRWIVRIGLWAYFLWRVARLKLHLVPTHPDAVGGLGFLEVVHTQFLPLALAISAVQAGSFAEDLSSGTMSFEAIYPALALILIADVVLFLGPLLVFTPPLVVCRIDGLRDYMELAARYVNGFDRKWVRAEAPPEESLLGTSDLQSLADLSNSVNVVRGMRWIPVSSRLLTEFAIAALLPLLPLLLLRYPVVELVEMLFARLAGL